MYIVVCVTGRGWHVRQEDAGDRGARVRLTMVFRCGATVCQMINPPQLTPNKHRSPQTIISALFRMVIVVGCCYFLCARRNVGNAFLGSWEEAHEVSERVLHI